MLLRTLANIGEQSTRVLHYRYHCDSTFQNCVDEEQFFLAKAFGLWQWKHFQSGGLVKSTLMTDLEPGSPTGTLPCPQSYQ